MKLTVIHQTPPPSPPIEKIVLEITPQEAAYLRTALNRIGGACPARDFFDSINYALSKWGIVENADLLDKGHHGIYFKSTNQPGINNR